MSYLPFLVYFHILLMVFWIGTDIGVFIAGLRFIDPSLSVEQRTAVINVAMVVDRFPRICFVAMAPVGLQLTYALGLLPISKLMIGWIWVLSGIWMFCAVAGMLHSGRPAAARWHTIERVFRIVGLVAFTGTAIAGFGGRMRIPTWLAGKLMAYGAMCLFAMLLERSFAPVLCTFGNIAKQGSTPQREAELRHLMIWTYVWVGAIYAAVLTAGFLGTAKP